jgi:pimeloyl-ACP methyl ester carboxylesterase
MRATAVTTLLFPALARAESVRIPGPEGPLEAEMIPVENARHAVVIIPGSGLTDRDGNSGKSLATNTYRLLAEGLAQAGIASLRIDKRGLFGSAQAIADPNAVIISAYAEDARNWVDFASTLAPCVWIVGHSEGGLVALVAAEDAPESLCGLILLATPGRPVGQLLIEQLEGNPQNARIMAETRAIVADLTSGQRRDPASVSAILRPLFPVGLQGFLIDLFSHDPVVLASAWHGHALIVQGDADLQVRPLDADLLEGAMPQARRIDLSQGTHMMKAVVEGQPLATYQDPTLPLHHELISSIVRFLDDLPEPH